MTVVMRGSVRFCSSFATRKEFWWQVKLKMKTGNNFKMRGVDRLDGGQTG